YYIYAYWTGSAIALEYSTTAYAAQAGTGILIKSGDATRTLVGLWSSGASAATWSTSRCEGGSWFNPRYKTQFGGANLVTTGSTSFVEIASGARVPWLSFTGRAVTALVQVRCYIDTNSAAYFANISQDGIATPLLNTDTRYQQVTAVGCWGALFGSVTQLYGSSEARHYMTAIHKVSSGNGSADSHYLEVGVWG